jgi:hypothetical protein
MIDQVAVARTVFLGSTNVQQKLATAAGTPGDCTTSVQQQFFLLAPEQSHPMPASIRPLQARFRI